MIEDEDLWTAESGEPEIHPGRGSLDCDRIHGSLYQGSMPPTGDVLVGHGFHLVVLAAQEYQPDDYQFTRVRVVRAMLDDDRRPIRPSEWREAVAAAYQVTEALAEGKRCLTSCRMGWNRSGLVSALAIHLLTGMSGREATALVQERRADALYNPWFVRMLARLPGRSRAA